MGELDSGTFAGGNVAGPGSPRDLVAMADVQTALPRLKPSQLADVPAIVTAVSVAFEGLCRRPLALQDFDRVYRPGRARKIYLDTWPVVSCRLRTDLVVALSIANTDATTNQVATVQKTPTKLLLTRIASGAAPIVAALTLADSATVTALAAAVGALGGGWSAAVASGMGPWAVSELNDDRETVGALLQAAELRVYARDINRWALDPARGIVELTENRPQEFRYPDRAYGNGYGWAWSAAAEPRHAGVRATYRAGYAVLPWDLGEGYEPVPEPIRRAAIMSVQATLDATPAPAIESETAGAYSYRLASAPAVIPDAAARLLGPYINKRM